MGARIMDNKEHILTAVSDALEAGKITKNDLLEVIRRNSAKHTDSTEVSGRLSAVDIMFYIAGIVLFAAIATLIGQSWDSGPALRIFLSAGIGALLWAAALFYIHSPKTDDIRRGMTNSLLLTGSLLLIGGGFIIASELVGSDEANFYAFSLTLALLGVLHISFGWQIRRAFTLLLGILLSVAAFPVLVFGILDGSDVPLFINCLIFAATGGLLAYATRTISRVSAGVSGAERTFDPLSAFIVLMSLYAASYDESTGLFWLLVLVLGIVGLFYLSITAQNKLLLGNGSLFLVLSIITISYRYFSDNVAVSLLVSAAGLLGTAIMAAHINRRYLN